MVTAPRTAQIVLAAGRSERMGSPKPLLDFGGRTALRLSLDAAAGAGVASSAVVVGRSAAEVRAAHPMWGLPLPVRWVLNDEEGSEQLRSLQLGLEALRGEGFVAYFIHPVDHPLATSDDYRRLLEALASDAARRGVFILSHGGRRGHPVLVREGVAEKLLALGPGRSARDVIEGERVVYTLTENAGVLEDMDTPEEYRGALARYLARGI